MLARHQTRAPLGSNGRSRTAVHVVAATRGVTVGASARLSVASSPSIARVSIPSNNSSFVSSLGLRLKVAKTSRAQPSTGLNKRTTPRMCGIIGIYKCAGPANVEVYEGLLMLQHRGQDSAGMVTTDFSKFKEYKENGLVKDVFADKLIMDKMEGTSGMGHVRYPTAGSADASEAQPFFVNSPLGMYMIHNGNLTNTPKLRTILNSSRSFFNRHLKTDSDSEVLLNILADEVHRAHQRCLQTTGCDPNQNKVNFLFEAATAAMGVLEGAYSVICLVKDVGLVAFRDPHGIRPLVLGKRVGPNGTDYCISSEDCAFGPIGYERVRDVLPGEMIIVTPEGELLTRQCVPGVLNPCIFEYIYLARPDSVMNDIPVYNFQLNLGSRLAKQVKASGWEIDLICPVPDGARPAAIQMAADLDLPYREGLVKNRYVGRTFIMPDQRLREMSVRRKLNAMPAVFEGKNVLLVDDSIVRGTTMSQIVDMVRKAGASKVYLASASPPVLHANVYGVDLPNKKEFVANGLTNDQIMQVLGADGLLYQTVEDLIEAGHEMNPDIKQFDASCFDGIYVTGNIDEEYIAMLESAGRGKGRTTGTSPRKELMPAAAA